MIDEAVGFDGFFIAVFHVAHEGDDVVCPACSTTGKIKCEGPREVMTAPGGRHAAPSGDLGICKCEPPPKLLASQQTFSVGE